MIGESLKKLNKIQNGIELRGLMTRGRIIPKLIYY